MPISNQRSFEQLDGALQVALASDSRLIGKVEWRGRCIDLSKAYKQIPVSSASSPFAVLMVHHYDTGRPIYFVSNSLRNAEGLGLEVFRRPQEDSPF
jgi:hypothetical protein